MLTSVVGFYSLPLLNRLQPRYSDTPMTKVIGNCVVIVVLSSALPVLSRTLGLSDLNFSVMCYNLKLLQCSNQSAQNIGWWSLLSKTTFCNEYFEDRTHQDLMQQDMQQQIRNTREMSTDLNSHCQWSAALGTDGKNAHINRTILVILLAEDKVSVEYATVYLFVSRC